MPEVARNTKFRVVSEASPAHHDDGPDPDGVMILDTGSWPQLHAVREWLLDRHDIAGVMDHHRQGNADVAARRVVLPETAAVCEPVAELCRLLLKLPSITRLPIEVAEPLYLGRATDTGWFRQSNVSPSVMRLAADLLQAGVNHTRLYELTDQRDRVSRLRLLGRALASLEMLQNDRVAMMTLTLKDFEDCRAAPTDSGGFSDFALACESVKISVILTEAFRTEGESGHVTKISFRSKSGPGGVNVAAIAEKLGGRGHIPAAGAKLPLPLAQAKQKVIEALK